MRPIRIRGQAAKMPLICAPLVGAERAALIAEARAAVAAGADIVEWRADHFRAIADATAVLDAGRALRIELREMPLLFTVRSAAEGGKPVPVSGKAVADLYSDVCAAGLVDLVDYEMGAEHVARVREATRGSGVGLVCSFHDFERTPPVPQLLSQFRRAEQLGGDVAKVSVMARSLEDALTLLSATLQASRAVGLPLIGISMGPHGALSRMAGFAFGSALTFGVAAASSAPGQMPIADLRSAIEIARRAFGS